MQQPSFQPACSFQLFLSDCSDCYLIWMVLTSKIPQKAYEKSSNASLLNALCIRPTAHLGKCLHLYGLLLLLLLGKYHLKR